MLHTFIITLHSLTRWAVVIFLVAAVCLALYGWLRKRPWTDLHKKTNLGLVLSFDLQFMIGMYLWLFVSHITQGAFQDMGRAMKHRETRFFVLEHPFMMTIALVLIHVGQVTSKKAGEDGRKHKFAAIFFLLAAFCVLSSIPWPFLPKGIGRPLLNF